MSQCFRCGSSVKANAVKCQTCGAELKAFGHPGIELHRSQGDQSLCLSCAYHADDSCDYDKRPTARDCTMYRDVERRVEAIKRPGARLPGPSNQALIIAAVIIGLILLAILMR